MKSTVSVIAVILKRLKAGGEMARKHGCRFVDNETPYERESRHYVDYST